MSVKVKPDIPLGVLYLVLSSFFCIAAIELANNPPILNFVGILIAIQIMHFFIQNGLLKLLGIEIDD